MSVQDCGLLDMYKPHATGISNSLVVLLKHREVERGGKALQRAEVLYFFTERLLQAGVAGEEIKLSSCLQIQSHSEFIKTVLQVKKEVLSALG